MGLSSDEDREAAAADFLAQMDRQIGRGADAHFAARFEAWCRADRRNLAAYLRLLEAWNRLDALDRRARECSSGIHGQIPL
jgi:ferric-dicitrate binding protein FerR (iron transport regulator)